MAAIGRRWVRSTCPGCASVRDFTLEPDWDIRCPQCGYRRGLRRELRLPRPRRLLATR